MNLVLVLRAAEDAARTAGKLRALGYAAVLSPVLEFAATHAIIPCDDYDGVIVTSAKGVEFAGDARQLRAAPLHAVGEKTAEAARARGFQPDIVAGNAEAMLPRLLERYQRPAVFLYLAGRDRQPVLEAGLRGAGHDVHTVEVYDARAAQSLTAEALAAIAARRLIAALHYSRRSAEIFLRLAQAAGVAEALRDMTHVALSEHVAAPLRKLGLETRVAAKPDEEHLLALLSTQLRRKTP
ncbi:uroporphyrinogen-III synthase [Methylocystis sp. SC2]|uniref:uroporphyrinogen-III synthase n=1 Tax=Methylocystis sp. (strain SC2) TaxID=187303 RepID=UPI0002E3A0D6|nr:uroporphyrinogen-III synthase [Methylocystis sp. SC2]